MQRSDPHRRAIRLLVGAAVLLAVLALVLSYAGRAVLRSGPFADRATAALRNPAVQGDVADHLTDAVVRANGDLISVRPLIRAVAGAIVASTPFEVIFRRAVLEAHRAVVSDDRPRALVDAADSAVLIHGALQRLAPGAAATIGAERAVDLFSVHPPAALREVVQVARAVYTLAWVLAVVAIILAATALRVSAHPARTGRALGVGLAVGGLFVVALYLVGLAVVGQTAPAGRAGAAQAIWRVMAGGLRTQALWLAAAGAVVFGAASAWMLDPAVLRESGWLRAVVGTVGARLRGVLPRSLLAIGAGAAILLEPGVAVAVVAIAVGLLLVAVGVGGVLTWAGGLRPAARPDRASVTGMGARALRRGLPVAVALLALAGAMGIIASGGGDEAPAATPVTCNGYVALCGRTLDDVSLAATHNSFASVTIPTFLFGQQDGTIADQLRFGIHGFLIDTYYGFPGRDRVLTDTTSLPKRAAAVEELGEPAVKAAESIRSRLGSARKGRRAIYLCHGFCELGAVPLASALSDLRTFMAENPGEVIMIINQDEGVRPDDIARAFEQAGLGDMIYRGSLGPFPTLGQMVQSGQRLVVMAENDAGKVPWYHPAYAKALQETPFRFRSAAALTDPAVVADTCRPNRGLASAPLFLINNWVDTTPVPRPSKAAAVNAYDTLLNRARTCERIRHRVANLVAVDFYRDGDVLGVVRTLNGIAHP